MTASEVAKAYGFTRGIAEVAEISGESQQNLYNWYQKYPRRFELLLIGAAAERFITSTAWRLKPHT